MSWELSGEKTLANLQCCCHKSEMLNFILPLRKVNGLDCRQKCRGTSECEEFGLLTGVADKTIQRASVQECGRWVSTPRDFLNLGSREAVDQSLSRLTNADRMRLVGHGLYDVPRISKVLNGRAPVDLHPAIAALTRRDGVRIMPDGLVAANQLGLTNAVPVKASYVTDGHSRTLKIGGRTVRFRHAGPSVMRWAGKPAAPVVQALRWLGPHAATDGEIVSVLNRHLPANLKLGVFHNSRDLPGWALSLARSIASDQGIVE